MPFDTSATAPIGATHTPSAIPEDWRAAPRAQQNPSSRPCKWSIFSSPWPRADFDENLWYGASASDELFRTFVPGHPQNSSLHRLDFKGLNQFFGEVTAMQLKRDRVRAHVWGRVTARFNAIAENCAGVWKL